MTNKIISFSQLENDQTQEMMMNMMKVVINSIWSTASQPISNPQIQSSKCNLIPRSKSDLTERNTTIPNHQQRNRSERKFRYTFNNTSCPIFGFFLTHVTYKLVHEQKLLTTKKITAQTKPNGNNSYPKEIKSNPTHKAESPAHKAEA